MSLCASCSHSLGSCCVRRDILLTRGDVERIRLATGRDDFHEHRPPDPNYRDQGDDPNWNRYTLLPDGRRRTLRRREFGRCWFLTDRGCSLDSGTRPLICRLFPVSYNEEGISGIDPECASLYPGRPGLEILRAIGMDLPAVELWRRQLYRELREENAWPSLVEPLGA